VGIERDRRGEIGIAVGGEYVNRMLSAGLKRAGIWLLLLSPFFIKTDFLRAPANNSPLYRV
jgi:hypothetical protein